MTAKYGLERPPPPSYLYTSLLQTTKDLRTGDATVDRGGGEGREEDEALLHPGSINFFGGEMRTNEESSSDKQRTNEESSSDQQRTNEESSSDEQRTNEDSSTEYVSRPSEETIWHTNTWRTEYSTDPSEQRRYGEVDSLQRNGSSQEETNSVNLGVLLPAGEGTAELECLGPKREQFINSLKDIFDLEFVSQKALLRTTGIQLNVGVHDECRGGWNRDQIEQSYLLIRKSENGSQELMGQEKDGGVLNISRKNHIKQLSKALSKVGISRYHTITSPDVYSPDSLMKILRLNNVDTIIADVEEKELDILVQRLAGLAEPASQYTWIFTSILSSEVLIKIEQLLSRTKVLSIFPLSSRKLLNSTVKMKNNAERIQAMESSQPFLEVLRLIEQAYMQAWETLCGGIEGRCNKLQSLGSKEFLSTYVTPRVSDHRRETTGSYMLIVYTSSSTDEIVDLEIPGGPSTVLEGLTTLHQLEETTGQALGPATTVRAIFSTVKHGTVSPKVIISETLSTIHLDPIEEDLSTTLDSLELGLTSEVVYEMFTAASTVLETISTSMSSPILGGSSPILGGSSTDETEFTTEDRDLETTSHHTDPCLDFSACVLYILENEADREEDQALIESMIFTEGISTRSTGFSLGGRLVTGAQLDRMAFPPNLVATVSLDHSDNFVHPQIQHFNLAALLNSSSPRTAAVPAILSELPLGLGWSEAVVVFFNTGSLASVVDSLISQGGVCVTDVVSLGRGGGEPHPHQEEDLQIHRLIKHIKERKNLIILSESTGQISQLINLLWDKMAAGDITFTNKEKIRFNSQIVAWSVLESASSLGKMAEDLPDISLFVVSETSLECEYCKTDHQATMAKGVRDVSTGLEIWLNRFSREVCQPALVDEEACIQGFRLELEDGAGLLDRRTYQILHLNPARLVSSEESLFLLAGEYKDGLLTLDDEIKQHKLFILSNQEQDRVCMNSTEEAEYTELEISQGLESNLQTLWGSIALGVSAFGILILVTSGIYTFTTLAGKNKSGLGREAETNLPLHYLLLLGLLLLFSSCLPFLLPAGQLACTLRSSLPGISFSIIISSMLVNLVSTWKRTIYTVNPQAHKICFGKLDPSTETSVGLVVTALLLAAVQIIITGVTVGLQNPAGPFIVKSSWLCQAMDFQEKTILVHAWLIFLTFSTLVTALACLKYCSTNKDARWAVLSLIGLISIWVTWAALIKLLDFKFREPVSVMALVVSALILLLCMYARKMYEYSEFGKSSKLELMSNILLSESPTNSQSSRSYQASSSVLPGIIAMPEFEDHSILGDSIYHAVQFEGRGVGDCGPLNLKMFEAHPSIGTDEREFETNSGMDTDTLRSHTRVQDTLDTDWEGKESWSGGRSWERGRSLEGDRQLEEAESIYHTISRGVSYKPVLKKIGSRKMLVLPDQHTLTHGSTSRI